MDRPQDAPPVVAPFQPGNPGWIGRGKMSESGAQRRARREAQAEAMLDILNDVAHSGEREETRVLAAVKFRHEVIGMPVQRTVSINANGLANLTDDQLRTLLDFAERAIPDGAESGAPPGIEPPREGEPA